MAKVLTFPCERKTAPDNRVTESITPTKDKITSSGTIGCHLLPKTTSTNGSAQTTIAPKIGNIKNDVSLNAFKYICFICLISSFIKENDGNSTGAITPTICLVGFVIKLFALL